MSAQSKIAMDTTSTNTSIQAIVEPINDDYEYIQYNDKLRLIHSIKDDMYQAQSILNTCHSSKQFRHWFDNKSTKEFLENAGGRILPSEKLYENREKEQSGLQGYYVHRLLVNHIAMWASPSYAWDVMELLDNLAKQQRDKLLNKVEEQKPRMVPEKHKNSYRYMIWKEEIPESQTFITLHMIRRNKSTWREINKIYKDENKRWYFKDNLPISMTPNSDIKNIVRKNFKGDDAVVHSTSIDINKNCLNELKRLLDEYFNVMQQ